MSKRLLEAIRMHMQLGRWYMQVFHRQEMTLYTAVIYTLHSIHKKVTLYLQHLILLTCQAKWAAQAATVAK